MVELVVNDNYFDEAVKFDKDLVPELQWMLLSMTSEVLHFTLDIDVLNFLE